MANLHNTSAYDFMQANMHDTYRMLYMTDLLCDNAAMHISHKRFHVDYTFLGISKIIAYEEVNFVSSKCNNIMAITNGL